MDFDKLEIKIEADSSKATSNVDRLGKSLRDLNSDLKSLNTTSLISLSAGVKQLSDSMALLSPMMKGKGNDFTTLSTRLSALANNTNPKALTMLGQSVRFLGSSLQTMASASSGASALASLSKSLSTLGYATTDKAISNLPLLTKELANMITTLSKLPVVNSNIQKLIASIAALAKQGSKVGSAGKSMTSSFNSTGLSLKSLRLRFLNISRVIGTVYANVWLLIRAFKALGGAIRTAMNYTETLNYFNKAFDNIAKKATGNWKELGYESADAYYKSFAERASQVTSQMARLTVGADGSFQLSGKTLGLGGNATAKYQAQFAQLASSMGVSSENATKLSEVMTKLGGDLSSIRDEDIEETWGRMSSGLLGMARSMDRYGANVRVAGLDQKLLELGIDASAKNLSQQDKMLLRVITTLDSTKFAWTDMIGTLYENANQLKLLKSGWSDLTTIIGGMFAPALRAVLPLINGVVVALQRLAIFVSHIFGLNVGSSIKDMGDDFSGISDALDDVDSSATGAGGSVKKLKDQLLGLDELNVIKTKDNSGGGGAGGAGSLQSITDAFNDATEEYLKAWQDAFDNMEDRISGIADTITNSEAFKTLRMLFLDLKQGDWSGVGQDISKLFTISVDGITDLLKSVDWTKVGTNIGKFLEGLDFSGMFESINRLIDTIIMGGLDLWVASFNEAPLETALITALSVCTFTGLGKEFLSKFVAGIATAVVGFDIGKEISKAILAKMMEIMMLQSAT